MAGLFDTAPPLESHLSQFGLQAFRPGQREVIEAVLAGRDCLCIMPTGGGKSLCYQLPSIARAGTTLVISPLIALMKDQVDGLMARKFRATFINSSLDLDESRQRLSGMAAGEYDLVYIAPERLRNKSFLDAIAATHVQLLAVDEAHCISEWGHDFRPDYARIGLLRERLGNPQTIALTATATPLVRSDVVQLLRLNEPEIFITGFARPNLHFEVRQLWGKANKLRELDEFLETTPGAGIIYAATRKRCEEVAEELEAMGLSRPIKAYHAGLDPDRRRQVQEEFMSGRVPVIVATNAFGMGIDKADLRFVVHFEMPGTLEAYYQEAGRAGRDGEDATCLLLFNERDRDLQEWFIENNYPPRETIEKVYNCLRKLDADPIELTLDEIKDRLNLTCSTEGVAACEKILEKAKVLERLDSKKNQASVRLSSDLPTLVDLVTPDAKTQRKVLRTLEKIAGNIRYEYVYFSPAKLEAMSELDSGSIARALRELQKLDAFDYAPPFRGRAIRMKVRDLPFSKLEIDFTELDRRKRAELDKVQVVVDYALSNRCRQLEILEYFGDPAKCTCGTCDNCRGKGEGPGNRGEGRGSRDEGNSKQSANPKQPVARISEKQDRRKPVPSAPDLPPSPLLLNKAERVLRMALSAVARTNGRVGKGLVAKMLRGSKSKQTTKLGLDQLSTFGLLALWRQDDIESLLDVLLRLRLIEQRESAQFRPILEISDRGRAVMKGMEQVDILPLVSSEVRERIETMPTEPRRAGIQPIPVGFEPAVSTTEPSINTPPPSSSSSSAPHYWTYRLFADGYTLADVLQIRNLTRDQVIEHLKRAIEESHEVQPEWVLSSEELATLRTATRGRSNVRTLIEELHAAVSPAAVELYVMTAASSTIP